METNSENGEKVKAKNCTIPSKPKGIVVDFSEKAKLNLKKQQSVYMKKKGVKPSIRSLAGKLLETAKA